MFMCSNMLDTLASYYISVIIVQYPMNSSVVDFLRAWMLLNWCGPQATVAYSMTGQTRLR